MRRALRFVFAAFSILSIVALIVFSYWARFAHPQLTETMLFLTYWKQWLFFIVGVLACYFAAELLDEKR
jgi:uncharacterized membrane protein YqjE